MRRNGSETTRDDEGSLDGLHISCFSSTYRKHRSVGLHADNPKRCPRGLHGEMVYCSSFHIKNSTSGSLATHESDIFLLSFVREEPTEEILICQATSLTSFIIFICKLQILIYVFSRSLLPRTRNYTFINRRVEWRMKASTRAEAPSEKAIIYRLHIQRKGMSTPDECSSRMNTNGLRIPWRQSKHKKQQKFSSNFSLVFCLSFDFKIHEFALSSIKSFEVRPE
jgi:hypothetical protein